MGQRCDLTIQAAESWFSTTFRGTSNFLRAQRDFTTTSVLRHSPSALAFSPCASSFPSCTWERLLPDALNDEHLHLDHQEPPTAEADHTQGDPCATGHSPRSNPQRRRIDRPRSTIDRDQTTAGPDWPGPALPLPGVVRSHPHPAGSLRSRHLHLRRSLHGRSPRAAVVVLHRRAKKEISRILTGATRDCHGPPAKISSARLLPDLRLCIPHLRTFRTFRLPSFVIRHSSFPRPGRASRWVFRIPCHAVALAKAGAYGSRNGSGFLSRIRCCGESNSRM
jgi:hypothetical protein